MDSKTIGVDIDGVLANFNDAYGKVFLDQFGIDIMEHADDPPVWHWPQHFGVDQVKVDMVWSFIKSSPHFWEFMNPLKQAEDDLYALDYLRSKGHEIYFLTNRHGADVKGQTWRWLKKHGFSDPTILITSNLRGAKGSICAGLGIDIIIDDKPENLEHLPGCTQGYLVERAYNEGQAPSGAEYTCCVAEVLHAEGLVDERFL
jgi:5'(3')-deoxyribonucleotidase